MAIEVSVYVQVRPTERSEKVARAVENIFPGMVMDIRDDVVEAYDGLDSLRTFHRLLREQRTLDAARSRMLAGKTGREVQFRLSKQAALMGRINFPPAEEPLGSIHVRISGDERVIDWLAPRTVEGEPVDEIDLAEEDAQFRQSQ